jgi:hypothetical protein
LPPGKPWWEKRKGRGDLLPGPFLVWGGHFQERQNGCIGNGFSKKALIIVKNGKNFFIKKYLNYISN